MPHRLELLAALKPLAAIAGAGACCIADTAIAGLSELPVWLRDLGLPVVFLILVIYALRHLFTVNQDLQKSMLVAKDAQIQAAKETSELFLSTTKQLIDATNHQTTQLEKLTDQIKSRPCQMPPSIYPRAAVPQP